MATYLDRIVAYHRERAGSIGPAERAALAARAGEASRGELAVRDFCGALVAAAPDRGLPAISAGDEPIGARRPAIIAEIKRRSPSRGDLAAHLDPARIARSYAAGGASCLSVLTDGPHFGGSPADLVAARSAVDLPVLRKDFTVSVTDIFEARLMGADAVLLIVAVLGGSEIEELLGQARWLGMEALVEVHDEAELARALDVGASAVGVNQRDLHSFAVDTERAVRVAASVPTGVVSVAESGIRDAGDVERLGRAGFDAVLVGEALVTAPDPGQMLASLQASMLGAGGGRRAPR